MPLFGRRKAEREARERSDADLLALTFLRKVVEDFSPLFPEDEEARRSLGEGVKEIPESFVERMWRHDDVRRRANRGDADAALAYTRAARAELVLALEERGYDASAFMHDHWTYGPFERP